MYRLLLVDDEHHIINWLYDLFRKQSDLELDIFKAYTANQALTLLKQNHMDIILSDIRMPGMDGFQLAEQVLSHWPACRILFLTGYDSFEYIYRANKNGGIRYLLKTEDDDEIVDEIRRAILSLEDEKRNQKLLATANDNQKLADYFLKRQIALDRLDCKNLQPEDCLNPKTCDLYLLLSMPGSPFRTASGVDRAKAVCSLENLGNWYFQNGEQDACFEWRDGYIVWIFKASPERFCYIREMLEPFSADCLKWYDSFPILLCHTPLSQQMLPGVLDWMANEIKKFAALPNVQFRISGVPETTDTLPNLELKLQTLLKEVLFLEGALEQQDQKKVYTILSDAKCFLEEAGMVSFLTHELVQTLTQSFLSYLNHNHLTESVNMRYSLTMLTEPKRFTTELHLFSYLENVTECAFQIIDERRLSDAERLVQKIQSYIRDNLQHEFTLSSIAELVNYSPTYVSRLFRQVSGVNLFDYIFSLRIEQARYLLRHTADSVQDIAEKIGFDSSQYFSTAFKRSTGLTPLEFRRQ